MEKKLYFQFCLQRLSCNLGLSLNVYLLYEYIDLFIDMDVRNNRSKLAIANQHEER